MFKILAVGRGVPETFRGKFAPRRKEGSVSGSENGMTQPIQSTKGRSVWSGCSEWGAKSVPDLVKEKGRA